MAGIKDGKPVRSTWRGEIFAEKKKQFSDEKLTWSQNWNLPKNWRGVLKGKSSRFSGSLGYSKQGAKGKPLGGVESIFLDGLDLEVEADERKHQAFQVLKKLFKIWISIET